jgi:hypothetical protein
MGSKPWIWQEYDCPESGLDFDIGDADIVAIGEEFYCCGCGKTHTATADFPHNTYVLLSENGTLDYRRTPKDAAEKAAWRVEVDAARGKTPNVALTGGEAVRVEGTVMQHIGD